MLGYIQYTKQQGQVILKTQNLLLGTHTAEQAVWGSERDSCLNAVQGRQGVWEYAHATRFRKVSAFYRL